MNKGKLKAWLELARISNLPTAWTNVLAGWLLGGGQWGNDWDTNRLVWLILAGSLAYVGGMILNDAFDAEWDLAHRSERPVPSGRVSRRAAWVTGSICLVAAGVHIIWSAGANTWIACGLLGAILLYNRLHKRWVGSVVIMGSCRALLYLAAGLEARRPLIAAGDSCLWIGAASIGLYVIGLTLVARFESRTEGPGRCLAWVSRELLYLPGVMLIFAGFGAFVGGRETTGVLVFVAFVVVLRLVLPLLKQGGAKVGQAVGWLLAGIPLVDAMAISLVQPELAIWIGALVPLLRLWQRKIAAT